MPEVGRAALDVGRHVARPRGDEGGAVGGLDHQAAAGVAQRRARRRRRAPRPRRSPAKSAPSGTQILSPRWQRLLQRARSSRRSPVGAVEHRVAPGVRARPPSASRRPRRGASASASSPGRATTGEPRRARTRRGRGGLARRGRPPAPRRRAGPSAPAAGRTERLVQQVEGDREAHGGPRPAEARAQPVVAAAHGDRRARRPGA